MRDPNAPDERLAVVFLPDERVADPGADAAWFRQQLAAKGMQLHPKSFVAQALDALAEMAEGIAGRWRPSEGEDQGEKIRSASGILFLIRAVRRALERRPDAFSSKWSLFRGADVNLTAYGAQMTQERDKMWELLVAALCEREFDGVRLANHENPDIRCLLRGEEWGIECKLLYTKKVSAQQDQLIEKAKQLEEAGIKRGVIAVNITGLLDHRAYIDSFRFFPAPEGMSRAELSADLGRQTQAVVDSISTPAFKRRLFRNDRLTGPRTSTRMILFWSQTVAFSGGSLALAANAHWMVYEQATVMDRAFADRIHLAARISGT